jgi:hypothetical protein
MKMFKSLRWTAILSLILSPALRANITVTGSGVVSVGNAATIYFNGGTLNIANGAQVKVQIGGSLAGAAIEVASSGKLFNCGTINAAISNTGEIVSDCGVPSVFLGSVTNSGTFRVSHGSSLIALGSFQNNQGALLDMITAAQTGPPSALTGPGTLIDAEDLHIERIEVGAADARILIHGIRPHTYQLMGTSRLSPPAWTPIGPIQTATGGQLQWNHSGVAINFSTYFYRVVVGDP